MQALLVIVVIATVGWFIGKSIQRANETPAQRDKRMAKPTLKTTPEQPPPKPQETIESSNRIITPIKQVPVMNKDIIVTTADLARPYEVIGPVYFSITNKGIFGSQLKTLTKQYSNKLARLRKDGAMGQEKVDWGLIYGEFSVGQNDFDKAFFIAAEELKKRAKKLNADAIIAMRQDIDLDTNGFAFFYLQMYGTAVRYT